MIEMVGEGAFGKVFLAEQKKESEAQDQKTNDRQVAIKIMQSSTIANNKKLCSDLENELRVHWALRDCDGILSLRELYEDDLFIYIVLDYQQGGSLLEHSIRK